MIQCWKCQKEQDQPFKLAFRATCEKCGSDLHVCKQCRHYAPGKPNDCNVPGTDYIPNRERMNFCEEFFANEKPKIISNTKNSDPFNRLFKD